jgi:hypothetical protein
MPAGGKQVLAAPGHAVCQISPGNWDIHSDIYGETNLNGNNMYTR